MERAIRRAGQVVAAALGVLAASSPGAASESAMSGAPAWKWRYEFTAGVGSRFGARNNDTALAGVPEVVVLRPLRAVHSVGAVLGLPWYSDTVSEHPRAEAAIRYRRGLGSGVALSVTAGALVAWDRPAGRRPPENAVDPFGEIRCTANDRLGYGLRVERAHDELVPYATLGSTGPLALVATAAAVLLTTIGSALGGN